MVDKKLLRDIKSAKDKGADAADKSAILNVYEFFKQTSKENEDLAEELEDMDITVQMVVTDKDEKFWIKASGGDITFGEGEVDSPSFTFSCKMAVGAGMLFGEVDATSAYMAGDITVEGNLQDAMAFQEIIELAMEAFEDLSEETGEEEEEEKPAPKPGSKPVQAPIPTPTPAKKEVAPPKIEPALSKKEEPKISNEVTQQIKEEAYLLSTRKHNYDQLCWFLAERQLKALNKGKLPSKDEIKKKAEELNKSKKSYAELCWFIAKYDVTGTI